VNRHIRCMDSSFLSIITEGESVGDDVDYVIVKVRLVLFEGAFL